jgi:hypothetical protein
VICNQRARDKVQGQAGQQTECAVTLARSQRPKEDEKKYSTSFQS